MDNISNIPERSSTALDIKKKLREYLDAKTEDLLVNHTHQHDFSEYDWWVSELVQAAQDKGTQDGEPSTLIDYTAGAISDDNGEVVRISIKNGVIIESIPKFGYVLDHWESIDGFEISTDNPLIFTNIEESVVVKAIHVLDENKIHIVFDANGGYYESADISRIDVSTYPDHKIGIPTNIPIRDNYIFKGYHSDNCDIVWNNGTFSPRVVSNDTSIIFLAIWQPTSATVTYDPNGGTITGESTQSYPLNSSITIYGAENVSRDHGRFLGWLLNGVLYEPGSQIIIQDNITLVAQWSIEYQVRTAVDGEGATSPTYQLCEENSVISINATPSDGYEFLKWTDDLGVEYYQDTLEITVVRDCIYTAYFRSIVPDHRVVVRVDNYLSGEVSDGTSIGESIEYLGWSGDCLDIRAISNTDYKFQSWEIVESYIIERQGEQLTYIIPNTPSYIEIIAHFEYTGEVNTPTRLVVDVSDLTDVDVLDVIFYNYEVDIYSDRYECTCYTGNTIDFIIDYRSSTLVFDRWNIISGDCTLLSDTQRGQVEIGESVSVIKPIFRPLDNEVSVSISIDPIEAGVVSWSGGRTTYTGLTGDSISGVSVLSDLFTMEGGGIEYSDTIGDYQRLQTSDNYNSFTYVLDRVQNITLKPIHKLTPEASIECVEGSVSQDRATLHYSITRNGWSTDQVIEVYNKTGDLIKTIGISSDIGMVNITGLSPASLYIAKIILRYGDGDKVEDACEFITLDGATSWNIYLKSDNSSLCNNHDLHIGTGGDISNAHYLIRNAICSDDGFKILCSANSQNFVNWEVIEGNCNINDTSSMSTSIIPISMENNRIIIVAHTRQSTSDRTLNVTIKTATYSQLLTSSQAFFTINSGVNHYYNRSNIGVNDLIKLHSVDIEGYAFDKFLIIDPSYTSEETPGVYIEDSQLKFNEQYLFNISQVTIYAYYIEEGVLPSNLSTTTLIFNDQQPITVLNGYGRDYRYDIDINKESIFEDGISSVFENSDVEDNQNELPGTIG